MNVNTILIGQILAVLLIFALAVTMGIIGYFLGKKKTETPMLTSVVGFFSGFIPPLALVFLMVLIFKRDIVNDAETA